MQSLLAPSQPWLLLAAAIGTLGLHSVSIIGSSGPELAGRYFADDAFYYLVLAENFPTPEFSNGIVTTGFHPLWWILLAPVNAIFNGPAVLQATLIVVIGLHVVAALLLRSAAKSVWGSTAIANLAAAIWVVHPGLRSISLLGVETAVLHVALIGVVLACLQPLNDRSSIVMGAAVGVAFLARSDSILFIAPMVLLWAARTVWRHRLLVVLGVAAVAGPWLAYLLHRGGFRQDSSEALRLVRMSTGTFMSPEQTLGPFLATYSDLAVSGWWQDLPGPQFMGLLIITMIVLLMRPSFLDASIALGAILVHVAQAQHLGQMREWYAAYLLLAIAWLLFPRVASLLVALGAGRWQIMFGILVALLVIGALRHPALFPQEEDKYRAGLRVSQDLPSDARIAAFNAGIYQWVTVQDVLNLDGVVNGDVLPHLRSGSLCQYLSGTDTQWLLDSSNGGRKAKLLAPGALSSRSEVALTRVVHDRQYLWAVDAEECERD